MGFQLGIKMQCWHLDLFPNVQYIFYMIKLQNMSIFV